MTGRRRDDDDEKDGDDEHIENGLAARLLFAMPPRRVKRWTEADLSWQTRTAWETLIRRLYSLEMGPGDPPKPIEVPLSPEGREAWIAFYNTHARESTNLEGDLAAAWSKLEGYAARLALIVHLVRAVSADSSLASPDAVDAESIAAGVALSRWFGDEATRVYSIIGAESESLEKRDRREVLRIIADHGGEITVRGLMRASRRFRRSADETESLLSRMAQDGVLTYWDAANQEGGRPTVVFCMASGDKTHETLGNDEVLSPSPGDDVVESMGRRKDNTPHTIYPLSPDPISTPSSSGDGDTTPFFSGNTGVLSPGGEQTPTPPGGTQAEKTTWTA